MLAAIIPLSSNIYPFEDKIKNNMETSSDSSVEIASSPLAPRNDGGVALSHDISLNWQDNVEVQGLLDVVVGIMAEEYVQVARDNKDIFTKIDDSSSRSCG